MTQSVKNHPHVSQKRGRGDEDGGMHELIKHVQQYDLQKKQEAHVAITAALVSADTSTIQEDTCTLP